MPTADDGDDDDARTSSAPPSSAQYMYNRVRGRNNYKNNQIERSKLTVSRGFKPDGLFATKARLAWFSSRSRSAY